MAVNPQTVVAVLAQTLSDAAELRNAAEAELDKLVHIVGGTGCLLEVVTILAVDFGSRQAAAIRLKNIVTAHWTKQDGTISELDRQQVRDNIFKAVIVCEETQLRSQLLETLFLVAKRDFPKQWPGLLPEVMSQFQHQHDLQRLYATLCTLRMLFKKYQYEPENRAESAQFTGMVFPTLLNLYTALVPVDKAETYHMLYQMGKIFNYALSLQMPPHLANDAVMTPWMAAFLALINKNPPDALAHELAGVSRPDLQAHPFWRAKKWAFRSVSRVLLRYGKEKNAETAADKQFAKYWFGKFAETLLLATINQLRYRKTGGRVSDPVTNLAHEFIENCVDSAALYAAIKRDLHFVLVESVLQTLMLTPLDIQELLENPQQMTMSGDFMDEYKDPKYRAGMCTIKLVKTRTSDCLPMVLKSVTDIFNVYAQSPPEHRQYILKEAAMTLISRLRGLLLKKEIYRAPLQEMMVVHIFPEFQSPHSYLRARACETVADFAKLEYDDEKHAMFVVEAVVRTLSDPLLHVKMSAARALPPLIDGSEVVEFLKPHVPQILDEFFRVYDELGGQEVVSVVSDLIALIGPEAAPWAEKMAAKFAHSYFELAEADKDDDVSGMVAARCVGALVSILVACQSVPALFPPLEKICEPVMLDLLKVDGMDAFEECIEMMSMFTYFGQGISPFMWSLVPRLVHCFQEFASDQMKEILQVSENYIRSTEVFIGSKDPNYLQLITSMGVYWLQLDENRDNEGTYGVRLLEMVLTHCKGHVDHLVPGIMKMASEKLQYQRPNNKEVSIELRFGLCDLLATCAEYNPALFHATCRELGKDFTSNTFNHWLSHLEHMDKSLRHQSISLIGLMSLFRAPMEMAQASLLDGYPKVLNQCLLLAQLDMKLVQTRRANRAIGGDTSDDEKTDDEFEESDCEDVAEHLDAGDKYGAEELAKLQKELQENRKMHEMFGIYYIGDNEYQTPLDNIDELAYFLSMLQNISEAYPPFYQQWLASLPPAERAVLPAIKEEADFRQRRRAEKEARKAAEIHAEAQDIFRREQAAAASAAAGGP